MNRYGKFRCCRLRPLASSAIALKITFQLVAADKPYVEMVIKGLDKECPVEAVSIGLLAVANIDAIINKLILMRDLMEKAGAK